MNNKPKIFVHCIIAVLVFGIAMMADEPLYLLGLGLNGIFEWACSEYDKHGDIDDWNGYW